MKPLYNKSPFAGLKKIINSFSFKAKGKTKTAVFAAIFIVFAFFTPLTNPQTLKSGQTAYAAEQSSRVKNLEYFELDKPIAVVKSGNTYYIAQSDLIVIYHNDTYDKIDLTSSTPNVGAVKDIVKCGTRLLILSDNGLFAMNLTTFEIKSLFSSVAAISVCETTSDNSCVFAVHYSGERKIKLYKVTDQNNFVYSPLDKEYILMLGETQAIALCPDYSFYYVYANEIYKHTETATNKATTTATAANQLQYSGGNLYYKCQSKVYSLSPRAEVADLSSFLSEPRGFTVSGGMLYACDYNKNKVVEYDLQKRAVTGFEISFTKIYLPSDFSINYLSDLSTVTVNANADLYAVDLKASIDNGFFCYVENHKQKTKREYLIVTEVEGGYYLIAGDCFALVDKSKGYTPKNLAQTAINKTVYTYSAAEGLKSPVADALVMFSGATDVFKTFSALKHEKLTALSKLNFGDYEYYLVQNENGVKGYMPTCVLTESIYVPDKKAEFYSADTYHKTTSVYSDEALTDKTGELAPYSQVMIYGESGNVYEVRTESGLNGYISKDCVQKPSYYRVRTSIILIISALSFMITALFLEKKYLYSKKELK